MKYQALIFDIDGTAVPNREDGIPSIRLFRAVEEAQEKIIITAATGRPWYLAKPVLDSLNIKSPCVISGGAQIVDPLNGNIIWEKLLTVDQVKEITQVLTLYNFDVYFSDDKEKAKLSEKINKSEKIIWITGLSKKEVLNLEKKVKDVKGVLTHIVPDWVKDKYALTINHCEATKKHALEVLYGLLKIDPQKVVAVGDSGNDLPLFEMAGYKVAVGNATDDLKEKADYVTESVEKDGLAKVIEKLILNS